MTQKKLKRIAAITMARNDEFFLSRWIKYYGQELGYENLYIYLDGLDQTVPENAGASHVTKLPHTDMSRAAGDKYRIGLMSNLAKKLFQEYDIVIGCDCECPWTRIAEWEQSISEIGVVVIPHTVSAA